MKTLEADLDLIEDQLAWLTAQSFRASPDRKREILGRVRQLGRELERLVPELRETPYE
jgi:hypothetical protein